MGPSLGGLLLAKFQWPVIFLIIIPIGLIGFYLGYKYLPAEPLNQAGKNYDVSGTLLLAATATVMILALSSSQGINIMLLGASGILLFLFCRWERNTPHPLLDLELFKKQDICLWQSISSGCLLYSDFRIFSAAFLYGNGLKLFHLLIPDC